MLTIVQPSSAGLLGGLRWGGGRVIAEPKVYAVYWGREWQGIGPNPGPDRFSDFIYTESSVRNYINFFLKNVGGSLYLNTLTQYCDNPPSFLRTHCDPPSGPNTHLVRNRRDLLTDERIWIDATSNAPWPNMPWQTANDEARRAVEHFRQNGQFQDSEADNAIFMIFTPPGKSPARFGGLFDSCARYWEDGVSPRKTVVLIPYNPESQRCDRNRVNRASDSFGHGWLDGYSIWTGRMLAAAITNPDGRTGWMARLFGRGIQDVAGSCALPNPPPQSENRRFGRPPRSEEMAVAPLYSNQAVPFFGLGPCVLESAARMTIFPDEGAFEEVPVGQDSVTQTFTLQNIGQVELHVDGPDPGHPDDHAAKSEGEHASDFIVDSTYCDNKTLTMEPQNNSCQVKVTFRPRALGERRARLRLYTDSDRLILREGFWGPEPMPPQHTGIPLQGTGQAGIGRRPGPVSTYGGPVIRDPKLFAVFWSPAWNEQGGFSVVSPSGTRYDSTQIMTYMRRFLEHIGGSAYLRTLTQYCAGYASLSRPYSYCPVVPEDQRTMITNPRGMHSTSAGLCNRSARCWVDTAPNTPQEPEREPASRMLPTRVRAEARRAKSHFETEDRDAIFLIFTPPGQAPVGYGDPPGEHCSDHRGSNSDPLYYVYVPFVMEYPGCRRSSQGPDDPFGHGYLDTYSFWTAFATANTIADPNLENPPRLFAGWRSPYEVADMCPTTSADPLPRQRLGPEASDTFTVPRLWSNAADGRGGNCVFESRAFSELRPAGAIDFGAVPATARASRTQAITLTNKGPVELTVKNLRIEGASDFTLADQGRGCRDKTLQALPPRNTCTVGVKFTPTRPLDKEKAAVVTLETDGLRDQEIEFVFGTPVSPIKVNRAGATFGKQAIGGISAAQRIEIENTGDESVELRRPVLVGGDSGDFRIASNGCEDVTLDPERPQCAVEVAFAPQEREGEEEGEERWRVTELEIRSSADDEPDAVRLWGEVANPPVTLEPRSWDFGEQRLRIPSYTKWFQVKNNGEGDLSVTGAWITRGNPSEFSVTNLCAISGPVAPGRSCGVGVTFSPTTLGPREATLRVDYGEGPGSGFVTAPVSGRGIGETFVPADPLVPELIGPLPSDPLYLEFSP